MPSKGCTGALFIAPMCWFVVVPNGHTRTPKSALALLDGRLFHLRAFLLEISRRRWDPRITQISGGFARNEPYEGGGGGLLVMYTCGGLLKGTYGPGELCLEKTSPLFYGINYRNRTHLLLVALPGPPRPSSLKLCSHHLSSSTNDSLSPCLSPRTFELSSACKNRIHSADDSACQNLQRWDLIFRAR